MYNSFYNRIELTAKLVTATPLYIGTGQDSFKPSATQGALLKNALNQPYIPGSSIKGVLRSFLESVDIGQTIIGSNEKNSNGCYAGDSCIKRMNVKDKEGRINHKKQIRQSYEELQSNDKQTEGKLEAYASEDMEARSCVTCRLFGSSVLAGKVKCADAMLTERETEFITEFRTGNAIDRDTHTAVRGALFDTEVIPAGTGFKLKVVADNLTQKEAEVLGELLQYFAQGGILLGGRSRGGLGQVYLEDVNLKAACRSTGSYFPKQIEQRVEEVNDISGTLNTMLEGSFMNEPKARWKEEETVSC